MKNTIGLAIVTVGAVLCLSGGAARAEFQACGGDYVCTDYNPHALAVPHDKTPLTAKLASAARRWPCADGHADVAAETRDEGDFACAAIGAALQLLGRCGITVRRPLHLEIRSKVYHPLHKAEIFGLFDAKRDLVRVTQLVRMAKLTKDTPFANLPMVDVYKSVIVHEVVHALMHQHLKRPVLSHAANEYPAYAIQLESLGADLRSIFLQSFDQVDFKDTRVLFNDLILSFDPFMFAARAYYHFVTSPNGCAHIAAIVENRADFIAVLPEAF